MIKWQATPPIQAKALKLIKKLKKLYFFSYIRVPNFLSKYPEKKITYVSNNIVVGTIKKQSVCSIRVFSI